MQSNWQLGSSKSNTANDVIGVLKKSGGGMLAQIKAIKEAEDMSESEAQRLKHKQEMERIDADKRLKHQSKLAHDLAQELTKPKASHTVIDTSATSSESGYSSTAVARQLAKPSLSQQLSKTNLFSSEDKTAASLAAKKASLKAPRRTLQDKDQTVVTTTSNKKSSVASQGAGSKANSLKRKGSSKQHKTAQAGKFRTSESSDELNKDHHPPRTAATGRTSVTGISDDEDFADDEVIPEPPRRVNSADGGKPRRPAAVFNAADVMKNLKLNDVVGGKAKDSVESEDIVFD